MDKWNWCRVEWDERTGEVEFDIRVEGYGVMYHVQNSVMFP